MQDIKYRGVKRDNEIYNNLHIGANVHSFLSMDDVIFAAMNRIEKQMSLTKVLSTRARQNRRNIIKYLRSEYTGAIMTQQCFYWCSDFLRFFNSYAACWIPKSFEIS